MTESNKDDATPAVPADQQADPDQSTLDPATIAWLETIMRNMKRMATDEAYRLEIAKNLS